MSPSQYLALDVGKRRTGVARASSVAKIAQPLTSVSTDKLPEHLKELSSKYNITAIIFGLPRSLNGDDTDQTRWTRKQVELLKPQLKASLFWQDEALTTQTAQEWIAENGKDHDIDSLSAIVILEDFLKTPEQDRQQC